MLVKISSGRRITLPKDFCIKYGLEEGDTLDIDFIQDTLEIKKGNSNPIDNVTTDNTITEVQMKKDNINLNELKIDILKKSSTPIPEKKIVKDPKDYILIRNNVKIVSNLDEGANFSRKVYSDCKLVIRTKTSYINKFCEQCHGYLAEKADHKVVCPYIKEPIVTEIPSANQKPIDNIKENIKKLQDTLSDKIEVLSQQSSETRLSSIINTINKKPTEQQKVESKPKAEVKPTMEVKPIIEFKQEEIPAKNNNETIIKTTKKEKIIGNDNSIIKPIMMLNFKKCYKCKEYYDTGFMVDNIFLCKDCTKEDVMNYINKNRKDD